MVLRFILETYNLPLDAYVGTTYYALCARSTNSYCNIVRLDVPIHSLGGTFSGSFKQILTTFGTREVILQVMRKNLMFLLVGLVQSLLKTNLAHFIKYRSPYINFTHDTKYLIQELNF
jgi:hypothetical protein